MSLTSQWIQEPSPKRWYVSTKLHDVNLNPHSYSSELRISCFLTPFVIKQLKSLHAAKPPLEINSRHVNQFTVIFLLTVGSA